MKKLNNKKGFTLMEMLIVVAIIAILIAIAIPTFSNSLTKARVAADEANLRSAYAEAMQQAMLSDTGSASATTPAMQSSESITVQGSTTSFKVTSGKTVTVTVNTSVGGTTTVEYKVN